MSEFLFYKNDAGDILFKPNDIENLKGVSANTTEGALEKHLPVYEVDSHIIKVKVGEIIHPMDDNHYIMFIALVYDGKIERHDLKPGDSPVATFDYIPGSEIYAYCNLHSLWKTIVE